MCSDMELGAVHRAETLLMKIFVVLDVNFLLQHCLVSRMSWCSFFPCIPWPAAMNKLKLTWVISDNKVSFTLLLVSCFRAGFISEFAPVWHDWPVSFRSYLYLSGVKEQLVALQQWVCVESWWGSADMPFASVLPRAWFPAAAELWERWWKMREGTTEEWENLIFEELGILGICGLPTQPFFLQSGCSSLLLPQGFFRL